MEAQLKAVERTVENSERIPEIVVYQHKDFGGWNFRTNLNAVYVGDAMNDEISSFVIVSGQWQFYRHRDFIEPMGQVLGPGFYSWVEDVGIQNDHISSFQCIAL